MSKVKVSLGDPQHGDEPGIKPRRSQRSSAGESKTRFCHQETARKHATVVSIVVRTEAASRRRSLPTETLHIILRLWWHTIKALKQHTSAAPPRGGDSTSRSTGTRRADDLETVVATSSRQATALKVGKEYWKRGREGK
ncbi:hypothetical protein FA15DRAFT_659272 [Coprinopsis marcescibilis]|uniref:Uncharacterized protein n=1 Tax=Coprinopsis marcescibilis TaxID=230819 RepID=A0A5C3KJ43_COPMA|nr:hypothetical protein FA15DRAFT_659272 [Coprinopsis marcescibilis]